MRVNVDIAIVARGGQVLICQRRLDNTLGGYWEFPGGKRHLGEAPETCVAREVLEEVGMHVKAIAPLDAFDHDYPHGRIRLHPFLCEHLDGEIQLLACRDARWIDPLTLRAYCFPPANQLLLEQAITCLTRPAISGKQPAPSSPHTQFPISRAR
jgi:mutator protein MutT